MRRINDKYNAKCNLSFIVDVDGLLDYKDSIISDRDLSGKKLIL